MKTEETTFAAVCNDGSFVNKATIKELLKLNNVFFYLKIEFHHKHTTQFGNTYNFYWFKIIDSDGNPSHFAIDNFEVIDIGFEKGTWKDDGMIIKIRDKIKNKIHDFYTSTNGLDVFKKEVFPALKKLNELGNWESYKLYKKSIENEKLIDKLYNSIDKLETKIEDLENRNNTFKSIILKLIEDNFEMFEDDISLILTKNK
jgi:hypothetical protein